MTTGSPIDKNRSSAPRESRRAARPVIITGGGTAGHTNPGIAVAQALVEGGMDRSRIHFVGGARGNEATLVGEAGFSIDLLPGRGIQRRLAVENVGAMFGLLAGFIKGFAIVAKRRPQAVLCLGGYAAFAASAAAVILRVPLVVTEQNARASAVNRLFARFATVCALPFPDTDLPNGVLTGNPIRSSILIAVGNADRPTARAAIVERYREGDSDRSESANSGERSAPELGDRVLLAVWAGSLGATRVNMAVRELAELWRDRHDVAIYHVIGRRDWAEFGPGGDQASSPDPSSPDPSSPDASSPGRLVYLRVEYENHMPDLLVAADLAVCRSGASTVTELAVAGLPAVLIPFPAATRNHQLANTAELQQAGGAIVVADAEVSGRRLADVLDSIVTDPERRSSMSTAAGSVARPNAARDVARLVVNAGRRAPSADEGTR